MSKTKRRIRANEHIRVPQVRLINAAGEQVGVVATKEALEMARQDELDLVEVAGNVSPPVCRILDLGKYIYSLSKKERETRKKQKTITVKEIKMTLKIEEHDYQTKLRNARRFLERGDKVKFTMFFRGREITRRQFGQKIIKRFIEDISEVADLERNDGLAGNVIHIYFTAKAALPKKPKKEPREGSTEEPTKETTDAKAQDE
ncbi:MAG: translation initiation factor IF-3 [Candidatus Omnitrophota bacterium]|nr:translation initiation factor IF-3 [Candidatus Omnitrophota bacterium]